MGLDDQLRFVSLAKGTDLKYVLLRLQKAVSRIEEALKVMLAKVLNKNPVLLFGFLNASKRKNLEENDFPSLKIIFV